MKLNIVILMALISIQVSFFSIQTFASGNESASSEVSSEDSSQDRSNLRKKMKAKKKGSTEKCEKDQEGSCVEESESPKGK